MSRATTNPISCNWSRAPNFRLCIPEMFFFWADEFRPGPDDKANEVLVLFPLSLCYQPLLSTLPNCNARLPPRAFRLTASQGFPESHEGYAILFISPTVYFVSLSLLCGLNYNVTRGRAGYFNIFNCCVQCCPPAGGAFSPRVASGRQSAHAAAAASRY